MSFLPRPPRLCCAFSIVSLMIGSGSNVVGRRPGRAAWAGGRRRHDAESVAVFDRTISGRTAA